jgi:hypothetical protein
MSTLTLALSNIYESGEIDEIQLVPKWNKSTNFPISAKENKGKIRRDEDECRPLPLPPSS